MFISTFKRRFIFVSIFLLFSIILYVCFFYKIFLSDSIIINFSIHPFDVCQRYPEHWKLFKKLYVFFAVFSNFIVSNLLYSLFFNKSPNKSTFTTANKTNELSLLVGLDSDNNKVFISEKSLYQNILITGTIGTGKTSSAMYPFTEQLISFSSSNKFLKLGMLILDVKGNYYKQVKEYCNKYNRLKDLVVIGLEENTFYNPLDKPNLKPAVLANRLKTILCLFSKNNSEDYWIDKAEQVLTESIKLCRLYNDGYVTFLEIHKLISNPEYYKEKISYLRNLFLKGSFSKENCFDLLSSLNFFEKRIFSIRPENLCNFKIGNHKNYWLFCF